MKTKKGFTLVELMVVVAIISILAGLLLPALNSALDAAYQIQCINNQKQLTLGVIAFANDCDGRLPGNVFDGTRTNKIQRDWVRGSESYIMNPSTFSIDGDLGPESGTLYPYVEDSNVYLCPKVVAKGLGNVEFGNGVLDYSMFLVFTGAKIDKLPQKITLKDELGVFVEEISTPIFVEESILHSLYKSPEGGFAMGDGLSFRHNGKTVIGRADGSVKSIDILNSYLPAKSMEAKSPSKNIISLDGEAHNYGYWNSQ